MWLLAVALFGLVVPNGLFLHWLLFEPWTLREALADELAVAFILDGVMATALLSYLFAVRPPGSVRWGWFLLYTLLGGLGFSIPFYLWLSWRRGRSGDQGFAQWWRGR
jgi:hypothetical protein